MNSYTIADENSFVITIDNSSLEASIDKSSIVVSIDGSYLIYGEIVLDRISQGSVPTSGAGILIPSVSCDSSVYIKSAIYLDSTGKAFNAISTSLATSNVLGIVESKESPILCTVRVLGVSSEIFTGLDVTKEYYLSDLIAGDLTTLEIGSGHVIIKIGQPYSSTSFLVNKGIPTVRA